MSETIEKRGGTWRRLRLTPLGDLLRGRLTGRLDWRAKVRDAGLASEAARLVADVVHRTRLWKAEKVAVAAELIAHFADGAEAGADAKALVRSFGDPRRAAKLITRAKRRARAWPGQLHFYGARATAGLWIAYGLLALYWCVGRPVPSVDYVAVLNGPILAVPVEQRGWPLYRQAILALAERPTSLHGERWPQLLGAEPSGKHWPDMAAWLRRHADGLELIRKGAAKPGLGFILGRDGSVDDAALGWTFNRRQDEDNAVGPPLSHVLLSYLSDVRVLADVLSFDAKLAREDGDRSRWERDVDALLSMSAQQAGETRIALTGLFVVAYRDVAQLQVDAALTTAPEWLDEGTLARLAHRLADARVPGDLISVAGERLFLLDAAQRVYTDDGHGDGRLTMRGMEALAESEGDRRADTFARNPLAGPIVQLVAVSRWQLVEDHDRMMDRLEASLRVPQRDAQPGVGTREKERINATALSRTRYALWNAVLPTFSRFGATAERSLGHTDGLVIGIGLELYKRRHGTYPATLDALAPDLLPAVPVDRITGGPLHYKLVGGKPLVYSVGADRVDDGGQTFNEADPQAAAQWGVQPEEAEEGDWVIYPWAGGKRNAKE